MGQTLAEKVFSRSAGRPVRAGETIATTVDWLLGTDATTPLAIEAFERLGSPSVRYPERVILVQDHFAPPSDIATANLAKRVRDFAERFGVDRHYEIGRGGVCHVLLPELGLLRPGELLVGADSHTCTAGALGVLGVGIGSTDMACVLSTGALWFRVPETIAVRLSGQFREGVGAKDLALALLPRLNCDSAEYHVLEFGGEALAELDQAGKATVCNMASEAGAKSAIMPIPGRFEPDADASYAHTLDICLDDLAPVVACPYSPSNLRTEADLGAVRIDQVVIGGCSNGHVEDFRMAARVLRGRPIHPRVRLLMIPGSHRVLQQLEEEGLLAELLASGAVVTPPSCGPCMGGHSGILAAGEVGLYTTNRNFRGRNGDPAARVFLCGPRIAALSALAGEIRFREVGDE